MYAKNSYYSYGYCSYSLYSWHWCYRVTWGTSSDILDSNSFCRIISKKIYVGTQPHSRTKTRWNIYSSPETRITRKEESLFSCIEIDYSSWNCLLYNSKSSISPGHIHSICWDYDGYDKAHDSRANKNNSLKPVRIIPERNSRKGTRNTKTNSSPIIWFLLHFDIQNSLLI